MGVVVDIVFLYIDVGMYIELWYFVVELCSVEVNFVIVNFVLGLKIELIGIIGDDVFVVVYNCVGVKNNGFIVFIDKVGKCKIIVCCR